MLRERLDALGVVVRDLGIEAAGGDRRWQSRTPDPRLADLARRLGPARLAKAYAAVEEARQALDRNVSSKAVADWVGSSSDVDASCRRHHGRRSRRHRPGDRGQGGGRSARHRGLHAALYGPSAAEARARSRRACCRRGRAGCLRRDRRRRRRRTHLPHRRHRHGAGQQGGVRAGRPAVEGAHGPARPADRRRPAGDVLPRRAAEGGARDRAHRAGRRARGAHARRAGGHDSHHRRRAARLRHPAAAPGRRRPQPALRRAWADGPGRRPRDRARRRRRCARPAST